MSCTFPEDVVQLATGGCAIVMRCWADEDDPDVMEELQRLGTTPLPRGTLEVLEPYPGMVKMVLERDCKVTSRTFRVGDVVRHCYRAMPHAIRQAGVVTKVATRGRSKAVLTGVEEEEWVDATLLAGEGRIFKGDYVAQAGWIGVVQSVGQCAWVEGTGEPPFVTFNTGSLLTVGELPPFPPAGPPNFIIRLPTPVLDPARAALLDARREYAASTAACVLDVQTLVVAINWLCFNQLSPSSSTSHARPPRYCTQLDQLQLVRSSADELTTVCDKVLHKTGDKEVRVVIEADTKVSVVWQDGSSDVGVPSIHFEHAILDEDVDVFPGDVGMFSSAGEEGRPGVAQAMNAKQRTVVLRFLGTDEVETVSALEFDPHGPPPGTYGLRRGDTVLVTAENQPDALLAVPSLGESEVLTGQFPSPAELHAAMFAMGVPLAAVYAPAALPRPATDVDWIGEVVELHLDGTVGVRFPAGRTEVFPLARLMHLDDGLTPNELDGGGFDAGSDLDMAYPSDGHDQGWETDEGMVEDGREGSFSGESVGWADEDMEADVPGEVTAPAVHELTLEAPVISAVDPVPVDVPSEEDHPSWRRFALLEEAPADHHYYSETLVAPSRQYMSRIGKEHNILASSLPAGILVRSFEDRSDLLRVLIIGPDKTPFQKAPFLFDIYLSPTGFPTAPPAVYFKSWAGTRVSPNLYVEGKVCLSLLGTWAGQASETWSAGKSSILQLLISIQSLIMTDAPYYTEPGFEKQIATLEGQAASQVYNERTFVLTRGFVKRCLDYPPSGFKDEIAFYAKGSLRAVIEQIRLLLQEAEDQQGEGEGEEESSGVVGGLRVLSDGGVITLERILPSLEEHLALSSASQ